MLGPAFTEVTGALRWEKFLVLHALRDALPYVIAEGQEQTALCKAT